MTEKNELARKEAAGVLAKADFGDFSGMGFENQTSNDMVIPFIGLLQALSPQVQDSDPSRIKEAKAGDLFNTVTQELIPAPAYFVPCCTDNVYVEWVPRDSGGGFAGIHTLDSDIVGIARQSAASFNELKTPEGNDLIETFYIYGLLLEGPDDKESVSPIVLAFTSTKIKIYKRLMTTLRTIKGRPPMFAFRLAISSVDEVNKKKQAYKNFKIEPVHGSLAESANLPGSDFECLLAEGKALVEAIRGGKARAAHESQTVSPVGDGDEPF